MEDIRLIGGLVAAIVGLVVLITRWHVAPFIALLLASIFLAAVAGLDMAVAAEAFSEGVGALLGATALVIGFGAILGALLAQSGGADVIAQRLAGLLGPQRLGWTMFLVGSLIGIGVWFTVGLVLLVPIAITLARLTGRDLLVPACAMLAGLSAMHGLAPPHPGPLAAIDLIGADVGITIFWSLVVGFLSAAIAGPLYWSVVPHRVQMPIPTMLPAASPPTGDVEEPGEPAAAVDAPAAGGSPAGPAPSLLVSVGVLLLPVVLMIAGSAAESWSAVRPAGAVSAIGDAAAQADAGRWLAGLRFLGDPVIAMLLGVLAGYVLLGWRRGFSALELSAATQQSLFPVANVLLIVGAGAGFSRVLIASGAGETFVNFSQQVPLPPLVLGWLLAASVRVATGSATTAITTAAGLMGAWVSENPAIDRELMVLAMGAGSLTLSHLNDGGFWFVKEYFDLTVTQTLKTWTVLETVLSVVALLIVLVIDGVM